MCNVCSFKTKLRTQCLKLFQACSEAEVKSSPVKRTFIKKTLKDIIKTFQIIIKVNYNIQRTGWK